MESKKKSEDRKRKKKESDARYAATRIGIGLEIERWIDLKRRADLKTHAEVAKLLLDHYFKERTDESKKRKRSLDDVPFRVPTTSTPAKPGIIVTPLVSEISGASSESETTLTAEEGISSRDVTLTGEEGSFTSRAVEKTSTLTTVTQYGRKIEKRKQSSFLDPFNLTVDVSELADGDETDMDDPDYEQSFEITAVLSDEENERLEEVAFEEVEFGMEHEEDIEEEGVEEELGPGVKRVKAVDGLGSLTEGVVCFAYVEQIRALAGTNVNRCNQPDCKTRENITVTDEFIGSALYLKWTCDSSHLVHRWCAQPVLNRRVHSADFLASLAILTSGNNMGKLVLWAQHMNLKFMSSTTFHRIQRSYLLPTVDEYWAEKQDEVIQSFGDQELIVLGDGRNDSPGHSAQYCSYTLMEEETKKILTLQTLDKRTTDRKSANMEKAGFKSAMEELRQKGVRVKEVVTDAHLGIGAAMKAEFPDIKHSHDIWHAAKNLGKKVAKVAQKKENNILVQWQRDIINHFWFACSKAGTYQEFVCIWRSLLHHITNKHEWILSHGAGINRCLHDPIDEDEERTKQWLCPKQHKHVLKALESIILDKRLLNNVSYYLNFRSTAELEVFHQLILMYCAKRFAYTPPVYRVRNKLAALDHNHHSNRPLRKNKDGNIMYHRYYVKKTGRWSVFPEKEPKNYSYVKEIAHRALVMRINDHEGMKKAELEEHDPRRISVHLAPCEPPATSELVKEKISRFTKKE